MDFLKKGSELLNKQTGGSSSTNTNTNTQQHEGAAPIDGQAPQNATGSTNNNQEDYGDKAFDFVSKKSGHTFDRNTSEKITDGARGAYEKTTGSKIDPKYSN